MPIDVTKIKPEINRKVLIDKIVEDLFNETDNSTVKNDTLSGHQDNIPNKSIVENRSPYTGKMVYRNFDKDIVVNVGDKVDPDGYTEVTDENDQTYIVRANELKALPDDYFEKKETAQKNEHKPGFWNTYLGDLIERLGASVYQFNGDLYNLADKTDKFLTKIDPIGGIVEDLIKRNWEQKHPGEKYKTWLRQQADNTYNYADILRQRSDRYSGKDYMELAKEGDYGGMVGEVFLTASESLTQSLVAMAGGGWGLALTGATAGVQKYDQLDKDPVTKDMPEAMKVYNSVSTGIFNALFEKLGDAAIGREFRSLIFRHGADDAKKIIRTNLENWLDGMFKKYGVLWMPVSEGIEEVATQISENITNYCTGATDEWNPTDGAFDSFVYGAAGGTQFSMVGVPFALRNRIMKSRTRKSFNKAKENLKNTFPDDDTETFVNGLTFMSPAEQEATLGTIARSGVYEDRQINSLIDFVRKANIYKDWNKPEARETDRQAGKELAIQIALHDFDQSTSQLSNEEGYIQEVMVAGREKPVYIVRGKISVNKDNDGVLSVDITNSSKELFYKDENGEMQIIPPFEIEKIENFVNVLSMREEYEAALRKNTTLQDSESVADNSEAINLSNGDVAVYRNNNGDEVEGIISDAFSDAENIFLSDGTIVNKKDIISTSPALESQSNIENQNLPHETIVPESTQVSSEEQPFEIEPGVTALKQNNGTYILDKNFTKSELEKGKKFTERLNADYEGENIQFELIELPKTNPNNPLEKIKFGIIGHIKQIEKFSENVSAGNEEKLAYPEVAKAKENSNLPLVKNDENETDIPETTKEALSQPSNSVTDAHKIPKKEKSSRKKKETKSSKTEPEIKQQTEEDSKIFGTNNKLVSRERYEELKRQWLEKTRGQLNAGFDPELLTIGIQMAVFHIEAGARKFADFAHSMVSDIGDSIKPYLVAIYEGAKHMPGMEFASKDMDSSEFISKFNVEEVEKKLVADEEIKKRYYRYKRELDDLYARKKELDKTEDGFILKEDIANKEQAIHHIEETFGESLYVPEEKAIFENQIRSQDWDKDHVIVENVPKNDGEPEKVVEEYLNRQEDEETRSIPNAGGKNQGIVDAGVDATRDISDVQTGQTEEISDEGSRQSNKRERGRDEDRDKPDRSSRDSKRNNSLPNQRGTGENAGTIKSETNRRNRRVSEPALVKNSRNYVISDPDNIVPIGQTAKIKANISAIRLLKQIESEGRTARSEEQKKLSQYSGWGGLAEVLNKDKADNINWTEKYGNFYKQIKELLTEDEFLSAINSTINAHYTPGNIIVSLWNLVERLGFKGGKVLEPAAGVGNFLGLMPSHLSAKSNIAAYELDVITGRILSQLYPDVLVKVTGYENSKDRGFDLIMTNVPFGQTAPYDPVNKGLSKFSLHNYFISKGIKQLKPGGLGIFITSYTTMDSGASAKFREWVGSEGNADFIGAIRLPNNAFSQNAGTEVTTDILVFCKRDDKGVSPYNQAFRYALPFKETQKKDGSPVTIDINEYYVKNPNMMLGEPMLAYQVKKGGLYSSDDFTLHPRSGENLSLALKEAIQNFTVDIADPLLEIDANINLAEETDKEGTLLIRDGELREVVDGELHIPDWVNEYTTTISGKRVLKREVAKQYIDIRETVNNLVEAELHDHNNIEELRHQLNNQYDSFVGKYGELYNNLKLRFICDSDINWCNVFALEKVESKYEDDNQGRLKKVYYIEKSDIFNKRVSFPVTEPTMAKSLDDAVHISEAYRSILDIPFIAKLLSIPEDEVKNRILIEGLGFENPVTGLIEDKDSYLSGFVRTKLAEAKDAAKIDERYIVNVTALEKVIPADIPPSQIRFRLGTTFIPNKFIEQFIKDKLDVTANVSYIPILNRWTITNISNQSNPKNKSVYATNRITGIDLVYKGLNITQPVIYDITKENGKDVRIKNLEETAAAQNKLAEIENEFVNYISESEEFINEVAKLYNENYNGYVEKQYSIPSFTYFPGANPKITLREHQRRAIPRMLHDSTLLAHQVGTGKTFTMITAAMEMRRLKIAKKPLIVVQNQTIEQFVASFKFLYPTAKILSPTKSQMDVKNRTRLLNLITYGDYDAIIIPQSFISMIPDNPDRQKAYIKERIDELENVLSEVDPEDEKSLYTQLTTQLQEFKESLEDLNTGNDKEGKVKTVKSKAKKQLGIIKQISRQADRKVDNIRTFEQLGVDALFVDEAHAYKKLGLVTKLDNVKGIDKGGSKRAFSMYMKVRYIQEVTGGKNVIFATGTPITNTMAELYTVLRFIAPDILQKYNIERFDEFASTFGAIEPSLEFTAAGSFKIVDRFKSYVNTPELLKAFRAKTDVVLTEDIKEFKAKNTIPKLKDGQFTQVIIKQSEGLKNIMNELRKELEEWENLTGKEKRKKRHIPLVVFNKAKQAAIDLRLLNPDFADDPGSKTNRVVSEIVRIYNATSAYKGTQLVFSDIYQSPDTGSKFNRFNLYEDIKQKLIVKGIPENEIAIFNHYKDSQRELLLEQINKGEKRIAIGGQPMSTGLNVQEILAALHHMDAPPRPIDFEQRNGRILRQGNMHAEMNIPVEILTYGVERTLDATAYQRLLIKQNFINQMMKGENLGREVEDLAAEDDACDLNFNQMMATLSGSQYAMLHQQRCFELKKLEMMQKSFERRQIELNKELKNAHEFTIYYERKIENIKENQSVANQYFPDNKITSIKIEGKVYYQKLSEVLNQYFEKLIKESIKKTHLVVYRFYLNGHNNPVNISLLSFFHLNNLEYKFSITSNSDGEISSTIQTGQGFINSFSKLLDKMKNSIEEIKERQKYYDDKIPILKEELKKPFDKFDKLESLKLEVADLEDKMQKEVLNETGIDTKKVEEREKEEIKEITDQEIISDILPNNVISKQGTTEIQNYAPEKQNAEGEIEGLALPVIKTKHTKTGAELFVVKISSRISRNKFNYIKNSASLYEGKWSKFTGGFNFNTAEDAEYFREDINGKKENGDDVFFRQIEPIKDDIVRKYVKKWGAKVDNIVLPSVEKDGKVIRGVEIIPKMRENVSMGQPMFREIGKNWNDQKENIEKEVRRFKRRLGIDFTIVQNRGKLPIEAYRYIKNDNHRYPGIFVPKTGEVYIILDEITSVEDAQRSILHEVVGHKGIQGLFGKNINQFIDKVLRSMDKEVRNKWLKHYNGDRLVAAQEYVALFAEGYSEMTQWSKVKAIVRNFFRRARIYLKLTDQDLMYLLWKGVRKLQSQNSVSEIADHAAKDYALFREAEASYVRMGTSINLEIDDIDKVKLHNLIISHSFRFTEAYQDRMLAVKKMQELIEEKIGKELPDYMNTYRYENTLASKNTYETEFFRNNYLRLMVKSIATLENRGMSRRDIENYIMLKHGLERNEYMKKREIDKWYIPEFQRIESTRHEDGEDVYIEKIRELDNERELKLEELKKVDFAGISVIADEIPDTNIEQYIKDVEDQYSVEINDLWQSIKGATDYSLKKWFDCGMIDKQSYIKIKSMYKNYVPLRGWDETIAHDIFEYFTNSRDVFNSPLRSAEGRRSRADEPFSYIVSMAESSITGGNKNLMKLHLFRLAQKYPSNLLSVNKVWYEDTGIVDEEGEPMLETVFPEYSDDIEEYRKNIELFNIRMAELEKEGKAYTSRSILKVGLRTINNESDEHIVHVCLNGEKFAIMVHGNPRVAQAVNGLNDEERTDNRVIKAIRLMNRQMAANFTTRNPAFIISNLTRDLIFSISALSVKEGYKYRNHFVRNILSASGAVRRYINDKSDYNKQEDRLFKEFIENGGETGYTALHNIEKLKQMIDREIKNTRHSKVVTTGIKIIDFFEAGNRWAEDLSRFSTYMTSRQMGRSILRSVSDAKDVTVNFNRKGSGAYGAQVFRNLYLFFNAAVQSLANVSGIAINHPKRTVGLVTIYAAMGALVPVLLLALGGDDALKDYLNLPDYVRKNNLCLYLGNKHGFITIPLPIELRAFFGWGDSAFRYMSGEASGETVSGEVIMGMLDLLPLNPVGGDTPFIPDAMKPIAQSYFFNKDFTGRPIAKVNDYNKYLPEYQRVYRGTGDFFVKSSEILNNITGGDYATRGGLDRAGHVFSELLNADINVTNPAAIEHLFEAYLGGTFTTINQAIKTLYNTGEWAVTGSNNFEARHIPILNRFYNTGSIYSSQSKINEKYFDALDELHETESRVRRYKNAMANNEMNIEKVISMYKRMVDEGIIDRAEIIKYYSKEINKMNMALRSNGLSDEEVDALESEIFLIKEQMLERIKKIGVIKKSDVILHQ